ncbi:MAG: STAS domain-containing protein [Bacteroidota bacterium]|nr:STAS domain-containing protein [Bacteroidota bacterium]
MKLTSEKSNSFIIISLDGDLDASSSLMLDSAINNALEQNEKKIVIDCTKLDYVSSAGIGVFISYLNDFESKQVYFALMNVKSNIITTLQILGLEKLVPVIDKLPDE